MFWRAEAGRDSFEGEVSFRVSSSDSSLLSLRKESGELKLKDFMDWRPKGTF